MSIEEAVSPPDGKLSFTGIPEAKFIEDVESFMSGGKSPREQLQELDEQHQKYKFMESNLINRRKREKDRIPDCKSLGVIEKLRNKSDSLETQFLLSDQIYMKATIPPTDKVCLWLGANVMLEYGLDEAEEVLDKNLKSADNHIKQINFDLDFIRDQMTITEVNMARIYNWDVKKRKDKK